MLRNAGGVVVMARGLVNVLVLWFIDFFLLPDEREGKKPRAAEVHVFPTRTLGYVPHRPDTFKHTEIESVRLLLNCL